MADAARTFEILADPTRRRILERLRRGPVAVGEIAANLPVSRPAVSQHLKLMKESGLVAETRRGTRHYFALAPEGLRELRAYVDGLWGDALASFAVHIEREPEMAETIAQFEVPPVEKSVLVACAPERAFRAFTAEIAQWWPLASHSVGRDQARSVMIEPRLGGRVFETQQDGTQSDWGRVVDWTPPLRFAMTWHPGRTPETGQVVEVFFAVEGAGTRITLRHRGWERLGAGAAKMREAYESGWGVVLGQAFAGHLAREA